MMRRAALVSASREAPAPSGAERLAKVSKPAAGAVAMRERLFALLDSVPGAASAWIAGPPGAGKTVLAASYAESRGLPCLWYRLDADDSDPATFFYYLGLAVQRLAPRSAPLPLLTAEFTADMQHFARHFFRRLFALCPEGTLLVLDDHHEVPADSLLQTLLPTALREVPEDVRVLVLSRSNLPQKFAPLHASGRLRALDWNDLQLTLDETQSVVRLRAPLAAAAASTLHTQCEGWVAGLALMLESARRTELPPAAASRERRHVFAYFAESVFEAAPPPVQDLLMRLSILPRFGDRIAAALCASDTAPAVLASLHARQLFVECTEHLVRTYRFHDLFRDFLLDRARKRLPAAGLAALYARGARLLEDDGQSVQAFSLWLEAGDWDGCVRVVGQCAEMMIGQGRGATLREWIEALPQSRRALPWMLYWQGKSLVAQGDNHAEPLLLAACDRFEATDDPIGQVFAISELVLWYFVRHETFMSLDPWLDRLQRLLARGPVFSEPSAEVTAWSALLVGMAARRPDAVAMRDCRERLVRLLGLGGMPDDVKLVAWFRIVFADHTCMAHADADAAVNASRTLAEQEGARPINRIWWYWIYAWTLAVSGRHDRARTTFLRTIALAEANAVSVPSVFFQCHSGLAWNALLQQRYEEAEAHLFRARAFTDPSRCIDQQFNHTVQSAAALARGDLPLALESARKAYALNLETGNVAYRSNATIRLAHACVEHGEFAEATRYLAELRSLVAGTAHERRLSEIAFVEAYAALRQSRLAQCLGTLESSLDASQAAGYRYWMRYLPRLLPTLFGAALEHGVRVAQVKALIRTFAVAPPPRPPLGWPWPLEIRMLGGLEIRRDSAAVQFRGKLPRKPLQLLAAIVCLGGSDVPEERLCDAIWPDEDGDRSHKVFAVTLKRLRELLGDDEAIVLSGGCVSLDPRRCRVDAQAFDALTRALDLHPPPSDEDIDELARTALPMYAGALLPRETDAPWTVPLRERLRARFVRLVALRAARLEARNPDEAMLWYRRGIEADDLCESFYLGLMRCHDARDRRAEALSVYRRLRQVLSVTLGIEPSRDAKALLASLTSPAELRSDSAEAGRP